MIPKVLSFEFHTRFFPALLWNRLQPRERVGTGFTSTFEYHITFAVCIILLFWGIPVAVSSGSIIGWIVGSIGVAGTVALIIHSIFSRRGDQVSYDDFLVGVFFFFVILGLTVGIFAGSLNHSFMIGSLVGTAGLIAGYLLGILAALWFQYLGWLATAVNALAIVAILGMFFVDLVLLSGAIF